MMSFTKQTGGRDELTLVRYLLGTLPEAERDELEARYFNDPALFEQLLITENELIADYTSGKLSSDQRRLFEQNYLQTPEKRNRVDLVRKLQESATELDVNATSVQTEQAEMHDSWWRKLLVLVSPQNPTARLAMGFASIILLVGCVWLAYQNQKMRSTINRQEQAELLLQSEKQELERQLAGRSSQNEELARELRNAESERIELEEQLRQQVDPGDTTAKPPAIPFFDFRGKISGENVATAGSQGRAVRLNIPPGAKFIQVTFPVTGTYQSYVLSLQDQGEVESWRRKSLMPRKAGSGQVISALLATTALKEGGFTFVLLGESEGGRTEFIAEYPVNVAGR